jgi:CRISPR-associated endonuclease Cas3-HD
VRFKLDHIDYKAHELLAAPSETLKEHIEGILEELVKSFLKKRARALLRFLQSKGFYIDLRCAEKTFLYSAIFHDVGKSYDYFQERIIEAARKGESEFTVPRHELFSALVTSRVLTSEAFTDHSWLLRNCVLLSIVWSHSSSRGMVIPRIKDTTSSFIEVESVNLSEQRSLKLKSLLDSMLEKYDCREGVDLSKIPRTISNDEVKVLLEELDKSLRGEEGRTLYHATIPILSALQVVDSLVSRKNRGGEMREYTADLPDPLMMSEVKRVLWSVE